MTCLITRNIPIFRTVENKAVFINYESRMTLGKIYQQFLSIKVKHFTMIG